MAQTLDGDMRQGPTMCACHLGFIQQIITIDARNNNTTIQLRSFANPSCNTFHQEKSQKMPIEFQKCLPSTSAPHNFSQEHQV
jgi:hypothetical protein